jgi:hypothetical protein
VRSSHRMLGDNVVWNRYELRALTHPIRQERIVGSVELDVLVAEPRELVDLLAQGLGAVAQEALQARMGTAGVLRIVEVGEQLGLAA